MIGQWHLIAKLSDFNLQLISWFRAFTMGLFRSGLACMADWCWTRISVCDQLEGWLVASWFTMASFMCLAAGQGNRSNVSFLSSRQCVFPHLGCFIWQQCSRATRKGKTRYISAFQVSACVMPRIISLAKVSHMVEPRAIVEGIYLKDVDKGNLNKLVAMIFAMCQIMF